MMWPLTQMMKTRTRTSGREASRRARHPQLESLENQTVLSVTFAAFNSEGLAGTWAFNSAGSTVREITTYTATAMDEGSDGTLFASYPFGTFRYDYGSNTWTRLTTAATSTPSAASDNTLFASFSFGTWEYNGGWDRLTTDVASQLGNDGSTLIGSFSTGTYTYNNGYGWYRITVTPASLVG